MSIFYKGQPFREHTNSTTWACRPREVERITFSKPDVSSDWPTIAGMTLLEMPAQS